MSDPSTASWYLRERTWDRPLASRRTVGIGVLTFALCLDLQFFFSVGKSFETHPLAFPLVLEATLGLSIVWAVISLIMRAQRGTITVIDLFCFFMPIYFVTISSTWSNYYFDQPFIMGIGEDRRAFSFMFWFALDDIRRKFSLDAEAILDSLLYCAIVYLVCGVGLQILQPAELSSRVIPDFDVRKLRISSPSEGFALCMLAGLARCLVRFRLLPLVALLVGAAGLIMIGQMRQVIMAAGVSSMVAILVIRPRLAIMSGALVAPIVALLLLASNQSEFLGDLADRLVPNMEEFGGDNLSDNTRTITMGIVIENITEKGFMGQGSLSQLYDYGYNRIYGRNFFINDVGMFGEIFRLGVFVVPIFGFYGFIVVSLWTRMPPGEWRCVFGTWMMFFCVILPAAGWFYRYGFAHSLLFLFATAACGQTAKHREPGTAAFAGVNRRR